MKVGFLITARLKSTRLPKKLLLPFGETNYITYLIRRLKTSEYLDQIILCTSIDNQDTPLEKIALQEGIECYRGDREDVISRLNEARIKYELDYVFNMTADCPLMCVELIPLILEQYKTTQADLIHCFDLPIGLYLSGLKPKAMAEVVNLKNERLTEYWVYYFLKTDRFNVEHLNHPYIEGLKGRNYRIAIDYPEDHQFMTLLYDGYGQGLLTAKASEIIQFMDIHPELSLINGHCTDKGKTRTLNDPAATVSLKK